MFFRQTANLFISAEPCCEMHRFRHRDGAHVSKSLATATVTHYLTDTQHLSSIPQILHRSQTRQFKVSNAVTLVFIYRFALIL